MKFPNEHQEVGCIGPAPIAANRCSWGLTAGERYGVQFRISYITHSVRALDGLTFAINPASRTFAGQAQRGCSPPREGVVDSQQEAGEYSPCRRQHSGPPRARAKTSSRTRDRLLIQATRSIGKKPGSFEEWYSSFPQLVTHRDDEWGGGEHRRRRARAFSFPYSKMHNAAFVARE